MKIGLITFHFVHNQGGLLQCFALQKVLQEMGHDVEVIHYCPSYHAVRYSAKPNPFVMVSQSYKKFRKSNIATCLYHCARSFCKGIYICATKIYKQREINFSRFVSKNLNLTKPYNTLKALVKDPPEFDVYISGSDQLWNPELLDGYLDPAYFLAFGNDNIRKITYAVSLKESYTESEKETMAELCKNLDAVCLRESNDTASEVLKEKYTICMDPTLLLDREDYDNVISEKSEKEPYIFVYGLQTTNEIIDAVETISKELGVRVINGSPHRIKLSGVEQARDYGPDEFLSYIKNADFIITNSFHGTAFSIIYKKQFVTVAHTTRGKRMKNILEKLGLSSRIYGHAEFDWRNEIDYVDAEKKRNDLKAQAFEYLKANLKTKH